MLYLPDFPCDWSLSRWSGRPHGLTIDPLGVECFVTPPQARRGLFSRLRAVAPASFVYLHVLVYQELPADRIRSWAGMQVARLGVLTETPDAAGDELNRLVESEAGRLAGLGWAPAAVVVDGEPRVGSAYVADSLRWAAYLELDADRIALVGRGLPLENARLRAASGDEARRIRTDALRV